MDLHSEFRNRSTAWTVPYIHCLQVAITTPEEGSWGYSLFRSLLTDKPPSPGKVSHTIRVYVPYSFRTVVWVQLKKKCCEKRPTVCRPYPRRLGSLTVYRCRDKCSTLFSINRRPWILVRPSPPRPPAQQTAAPPTELSGPCAKYYPSASGSHRQQFHSHFGSDLQGQGGKLP